MGVPCKSFDGSCVFMELVQKLRFRIVGSLRSTYIPNAHLVVVSAASKRGLIGAAPFETADFLTMACATLERHDRGISDVAVVNHPIPRARRQYMRIPSESANTLTVSLLVCAKKLQLNSIINMEASRKSTDSER